MKRVVFFGTPDFAIPFLDALHAASDFDVVGVVTQADKPVGRKKEMKPSAVKVRAEELGLPVLILKTLRHPIPQNKLLDLKADLFVVVAYGRMIPDEVLKFGPFINVHPSLLPLHRGPSPMQAAILNGDDKTGVSIMLLDGEMDHGPILAQYEIPLNGTETYTKLESEVHAIGPELLVRSLQDFVAGRIDPIKQEHSTASYCHMIERKDGRIDWNATADEIDRVHRAFEAWPGVFTELAGKRVKLLEFETTELDSLEPGQIKLENDTLLVGTGSNPIQITKLQPAGKKPMTASEFANGYKNLVKFY